MTLTGPACVSRLAKLMIGISLPTFDLGFKTWVRPDLVGPRTGNEDTMRSTRFWRDSGLSFERAAVGSWIAVGAAEEVLAT